MMKDEDEYGMVEVPSGGQGDTDSNALTDELIPKSSEAGGEAKKRAATTKKTRVLRDPERRRARRRKDASSVAVAIKYAALFLLVAQKVGLVLLMRYSRTHQDPGQPLYLASTAVFPLNTSRCIASCTLHV